MARINLYNYRAEIIYYRKLRSYSLIALGVALALAINLCIFLYLQLKIMTQETRNSYLDSNITRLNNKLKIVSEFNQQIRQINSKIELVKQVDEKRDDMVALLQQLSKVTPTGVNFSSLIIDNNKVDFNGSAASPLYVADFLQNLRDAGKIFSQPMLKSNTTTDGNSYNFVISAELESNLSAETLP